MQANLISLLAQNDWDYGLSASGFWLVAPTQPSANLITDLFFEDLALTAYKLKGKVKIYFPSGSPIEINEYMYEENKMEANLLLPPTGIQIAQMRLSLPLIQTLMEFAENPDMLAGFVRLSDQRQVCMTEAIASIVAASGQDLEEVVTRRREQYWYAQDLSDFNRDWQQTLEANNPNSTIEYTYRAKVSPANSQWRKWVSRFRLVQDDLGTTYHVGYAIGNEPIPTPAG